jgi:hypothetical protein
VSLVVSLDVLPADVPAEYAPAMVAACSDALAEGSCALAASLPESTQPEAVALVLWQGEGFLQVTVRVGRGGGQWTARALTFSERDSISERWTTVGLTVATLVGETRALDTKASGRAATTPPAVAATGESAAPLSHPAPTVGPSPAERPPPATAEPKLWRGSLGLLTGPGWDTGGWQFGGWLSLGFRLPATPVLIHALGSYALSNGPSVEGAELSSRFTTVGIGAGLTGSIAAIDVAGSAALEVAYRRVDVTYRGKGAADQEVPVRLRALASFPATGPLAVTAGCVVRLPPGNPKETNGLQVREAALSAELALGLEVRL